jgi:acetyl-CoA acyltransferase
MAVAKIRAGMGHIFIAGGAESMSQIPMTGYKLAPNYDVANTTPNYLTGMGITAEAVAKKYGISREEADTFSVNSHQKAAKAIQDGKFKGEIVPIEVTDVIVQQNKRVETTTLVSVDEGVRPDTTLATLAALKPIFDTKGIITAGNASQTSDGAAFVLVASEEMVKLFNWQPIARMVSCAVGGVDPLYMGMGPCAAIPKALKSAGLSLSDIDLLELNEAFAAQALAVIKEGCLNPETVNVNGGAVALGHPLGCTGAKLTTQLINELGRQNKKYGMVTACVGGGQGIAGIYEKL